MFCQIEQICIVIIPKNRKVANFPWLLSLCVLLWSPDGLGKFMLQILKKKKKCCLHFQKLDLLIIDSHFYDA